VPAMNGRAGSAAADELLGGERRPTAVFCTNDMLALGLLRRLSLAGVMVPRDLAVVGYDDIEFAADAAVPLTSVRQPKYQLGRAGAELLLDEADRPDEHEHRRFVFKPELVPRASSGSAGQEKAVSPGQAVVVLPADRDRRVTFRAKETAAVGTGTGSISHRSFQPARV
jgi:LacI family transcriptional regulator, galactose operon repressor